MRITIIGKAMPDGRIKYIRCNSDASRREVARTLTLFFKTEKRIDALLGLGNLAFLGSTPYGCSQGDSDSIHCVALIRDGRYSKEEEQATLLNNRDIFSMANVDAFLFENGKWHMIDEKQPIEISSYESIPPRKHKINARSLSLISISEDKDRKSKNGKVQEFKFNTWKEMEEKAFADNDTYFIFSCKKLIATINPKSTPKV